MAGNRWDRLATYNAEVHRGIVHTPEYDAEMFEEQKRFDAEHPNNGIHITRGQRRHIERMVRRG